MDWNNDGKKDLLTGEYNGTVRIYLNTGTDASPVFPSYQFLQVAGVNWSAAYSKPDVVDWNNDGRKDIVCGDANGYVWLLLNTGTDASPAFSAAARVTNNLSPLYANGAAASPVVVDWDRDGKKDLIVGSSGGNLLFFQNKGTDANPLFNGSTLLAAGGKTIAVGYYSRPEVADWDNDGWLDLLVGSYEPVDGLWEGHVFYFHALSGPYLKSQTVRDANVNGLLERGEQCSLTTVLTNTGGLVTGVVATISSTSALCVVTVSNWSVGSFIANRSFTNTAQPFSFTIVSNAPFGARLPFTLSITGNGGTYRQTHTLSFDVAQPWFSVADLLVSDATGNSNCACNPGETVQLLVKLRNTSFRADGVTGWLTAKTPGVVMLNSNAGFGTILSNTTAVAWQAPFAFRVPSTMPSNAIYAFTLAVSYLNGSSITNLPVVLGDYSATSNTPFAWVDMTGASALAITDESYKTLALGFDFPFYGIRTNTVHVVDNGYLMFGAPSVSFSPMAFPATNKPNSVIAPWWEDLDPGNGGTVRYKLTGTAPERCWVAEWANVPRYSYTNYLRNFQVLLYENGSIKFQYGQWNGPLSSRAIGLENADGTLGKTWTPAVTNGVAILYSVQAGTTDSDRDGLPDAYELFHFGTLARTGVEDTDRDGVNNACEWACGTNPNLAGSRFCFEEILQLSPTQMRLRWQGIPSQPYTLWRNTNGSFTAWTKLTPAPLSGSASGTNYFTNGIPTGAGPHLFRVSTP